MFSTLLFSIICPLILLVRGCDRVLYITSDNKICNDLECENVVHSFFTLQTGSTICLNHPNLETTRIRLNDISLVYYYSPIYMTCDYIPVVESARRCFGASGCWSESECHVDSKYHPQDGPWLKVNENEAIVQRVGCRGSMIACVSDRCGYWNTPSCVWTSWWLNEKDCMTVFKLTATTIKGYVTVTTALASRSYFISPGFPTLESPLSLVLSTIVPTLKPEIPPTVIETSPGEVIDVEVNPINQPIYGTIGEYQKSLDNKTRIFPVSSIDCVSIGCESKCLFNQASSLRRIVLDKLDNRTYPKSKKYLVHYTQGNPVIDITSSGSVSFFVETQSIDHLYIDTPSCKLTTAYVFACTGCTSTIKVGLTSLSLSKEGIFKITSNCTLAHQYLRCQQDPYEIEILGHPSICAIWKTKQKRAASDLYRSNTTEEDSEKPFLVIMIKYEFEGSLDPISTLAVGNRAQNWMDNAGLLLTNQNFQMSLLGLTALTFTGVFALRFILNIVAVKEGQTLYDIIHKK